MTDVAEDVLCPKCGTSNKPPEWVNCHWWCPECGSCWLRPWLATDVRITGVTVWLRDGMDMVVLRTAYPSPFPPELDSSPLTIRFEATKDTGVQYVRDVFGVEPEVKTL